MTNSQTTSSAREVILKRIANALGPITADPVAGWEKLNRDYIRSDSLTGESLIQLFEHRLKDYGAQIFHCQPDQIPHTIQQALNARGAKKILYPTGIPDAWRIAGIDFIEDQNLPYHRLDQVDGVLTSATAAIAATGSIVLQHGPGEGRRAITLIPDYHLCIVKTDQVVETVPAAFSRLNSVLPTTFISGPSATADIEMTRIKGVHGPRFMDVILVG